MAVNELRGMAEAHVEIDCNLVAISTDSVEAHKMFAETFLQGLNIHLVEDRTGAIARSFEVYDTATHSAVPTTMVIDNEGELMAVFSRNSEVRVEGLMCQVVGNPKEVARVVAACQECDKQNAWSRQPRGTAVALTSSSQGTSVVLSSSPKASRQAGEPLTSNLSTTEEVDIAPSDSVSPAGRIIQCGQ